eukprot:scaffold1468_cov72-Skeletonema_dohrnii-CCMP3373.AAC.2
MMTPSGLIESSDLILAVVGALLTDANSLDHYHHQPPIIYHLSTYLSNLANINDEVLQPRINTTTSLRIILVHSTGSSSIASAPWSCVQCGT